MVSKHKANIPVAQTMARQRFGVRQSSGALDPHMQAQAVKAPEDWRTPKPGGEWRGHWAAQAPICRNLFLHHYLGIRKSRTLKLLVALLAPLLIVGADAQEHPALSSRIVVATRRQVGVTKSYDPAYRTLRYPGGDVASDTGVCSDVVVRALRQVGLDLQQAVHEDMRKNFSAYPQKWGLAAPDKNIDHRRVPNLMRYFERHQIAISEKLKAPESYLPGDIVAWDLGRGILHIGIISDRTTGRIPLVIHNIGGGTKEEDLLFKYQVIGHYRMKEGTQPNKG